MTKALDLQLAIELHALEQEWSATCKRNRSIERVFCFVGFAFCAMTAWLGIRPPAALISICLSVWLGMLTVLVMFLPLLLLGAWREWVVYLKMATLGRHPGISHRADWRARMILFLDYTRSARW